MARRTLLSFKPDIPFSRDDSNRIIPWVVALMVALSVLMLYIGVSLKQSVSETSERTRNTWTIHIPHQDGQEKLKDKVAGVIEDNPNIGHIEYVTESALEESIAPWLGDVSRLGELPLPTVIQLQPVKGKSLDSAKLQASMREIDPSIEVDGSSVWAEKYAHFTQMVRMVLYAFVGFITLCLTALIIFISRTALKLHGRTITLLHAIGASDDYIARQFQVNAARLSFRGGAIGAGFALLIYFGIGQYLLTLDAPLLPELAISPLHLLILVAVPVFAGTIGFIAVRISVLRYLQHFL